MAFLVLREVAEYPNSFGPLGPGDERIASGRTALHGRRGSWNTVQRQRFPVADVDDVLEEVRAVLRERGRTKTQWEVGSCAPAGLVDALLERGLMYDRDPYAVALILTDEPPLGPPNAVARASRRSKTSSPRVRCNGRRSSHRRRRSRRRARCSKAGGANRRSFGTRCGSTASSSVRGRPRRPRTAFSCTAARRWAAPAVAARTARSSVLAGTTRFRRGSPALITQGGSMSRPILERLGFEPVGHVHMLVDDFGSNGG